MVIYPRTRKCVRPLVERRSAIEPWQKLAQIDIAETENVLPVAHLVQSFRFQSKDSLHIACAIASAADYFITTDDLLTHESSSSRRDTGD
jgi:predicted nucleic acid-binding protein